MKIKIIAIAFIYLMTMSFLSVSQSLERTIDTLKNIETRYIVTYNDIEDWNLYKQKNYKEFNKLVDLLKPKSDNPDIQNYLTQRLYVMGIISKRINTCLLERMQQLKPGKGFQDIKFYEANVDTLPLTADLKIPVILVEQFLPCTIIADLVQTRINLFGVGAPFLLKRHEPLIAFNTYANWVEKLFLACMDTTGMRNELIERILIAYKNLNLPDSYLDAIKLGIDNLTKSYALNTTLVQSLFVQKK